MTALLVALAVIGALAVALIAIYNRLVSLKAGFANAFAQIEVQLKRRYDLIPNIVETAKAYMKHENETLIDVISARNAATASLREAAANPGSAASIEAL
ncbi:LemA family protein, partial [Desulfovibrio sp. OttesenSCG-928-O18]|nr:LemA family protein [Desulfovibrio sp. OttesenSCG-928-O18]